MVQAFNPLNHVITFDTLVWNKSSAWVQHTPFAMYLIAGIKPRLFVELGTHRGTSYSAFCQAVKSLGLDTQCFAIDTWLGDTQTGYYPITVYDELKQHHDQQYAAFSHLIRTSFDSALSQFTDGSIDLLHIDGHHTYESVQHDWISWRPKLSQQAIVLFHDVCVHEGDFGVWRLWQELQEQYPAFTFTHGHGLGVLAAGEQIPEGLKSWFDDDFQKEYGAALQAYFHRLGEGAELAYQHQAAQETILNLQDQIAALQTTNSEIQPSVPEQEIKPAQVAVEPLPTAGKNHRPPRSALRKALRRWGKSLWYNTFGQSARYQAWQVDYQLIQDQKLVDTSWYQRKYPDVLDAGVDPVWHYVTRGAKEGRDPNPFFDTKWYSATNPDVAESGVNPLVHYIRYGAREYRDPHPHFRTHIYMSVNPDVASSQLNPLVHYLSHGTQQKHLPKDLPETSTFDKLVTHLPEQRSESQAGLTRAKQLLRTSHFLLRYRGLLEFSRYLIGWLQGKRTNLTPYGLHLYNKYAYREWIRRNEKLTTADRQAIEQRLQPLDQPAMFTIILHVPDQVPIKQIKQTVASIQSQLLRGWTLLLVAAADPDGTLAHYASIDERIRVVQGAEAALQGAGWLLTMRCGDRLAPLALAMLADKLHHAPETMLIYSDYDMLDHRFERRNPHFLKHWDYDQMLSLNVLRGLVAYQAGVVRQIGVCPTDTDTPSGRDFSLRYIEQITASDIAYLPHILYHRYERTTIPIEQEQQIVSAHLERTGQPQTAEIVQDVLRIRYPQPVVKPKVSAIIPTRNQMQLIRTCVEGLLHHTHYTPLEIIIVDNGSDDPATLEYFAKLSAFSQVRILRLDVPFNFSWLCNQGVEQASGEIVLLLNNDIEVIHADWLDEMVSHALRPQVGAVGAKLYYPDNTIQHAGVILGLSGIAGHRYVHMADRYVYPPENIRSVQNLSAVTAACMVMRRELFQALGGFNETDLAVAYNDIDLCLRLRERGYQIIWTPYARLYHHESASRGSDITPEKFIRYAAERHYMRMTWGNLLDADPFYNPNLSLELADYRLAEVSRVPKFASKDHAGTVK